LSVVSTLAEDLDRHFGERSSIGLVARDASDRGLVGGSWYPEHDHDDVRVGGDPLASVGSMLDRGFGADDTPDLIAVSLGGTAAKMIRTTIAIDSLVRQAHVRRRSSSPGLTGIYRHEALDRGRSTPRSALLW
jgi:hypothetical protein